MARLLVPLVAILLVSRAYGAQVKITADGEAQERVAALQLIDDECAEQAVTLEHECDTGKAKLNVKTPSGGTAASFSDGTVQVSTVEATDTVVVNAGAVDDRGKSIEIDLAKQVKLLMDKVASLEDTVARLHNRTDDLMDGMGAVSCSTIFPEKWNGAGLYELTVLGQRVDAWCDEDKWTLILRATNDGSNSNGNPEAYPVYPTGLPPSVAADFDAAGVFRYSKDMVSAMRDARRVNDIRVSLRKRVPDSTIPGTMTAMGSPVYFPSACLLELDGGSFLPSGSPCYKSGKSADAETYDVINGHQDKLVGRWPGSHVNSGGTGGGLVEPSFIFYAMHVYPLQSVTGLDYCTWYDDRRCKSFNEISMWIY